MAALAATAPLPFYPIFPTRPGSHIVDAFMRHVLATASPETFPNLSMDLPPKDGDIVVLEEFANPRGLKSGGDKSPCAICSQELGKFVAGVLIWCAGSSAIYIIGYDCAGTLWEEGRLDRALEKFREDRKNALVEERLLDVLPLVPAIRRWIADHAALGRQVDLLRQSFNKAAPRLRQSLIGVSKEYDGDLYVFRGAAARSLGQMRGRGFLNDRYDIERCLGIQEAALARYDVGDDLGTCIDVVDSMGFPERRAADKAIKEAIREVSRQAQRIDSAVEFLSPDHLSLLNRWAADRALGGITTFATDGVLVRMEGQGQVWSARIEGLVKPAPVPG